MACKYLSYSNKDYSRCSKAAILNLQSENKEVKFIWSVRDVPKLKRFNQKMLKNLWNRRMILEDWLTNLMSKYRLPTLNQRDGYQVYHHWWNCVRMWTDGQYKNSSTLTRLWSSVTRCPPNNKLQERQNIFKILLKWLCYIHHTKNKF